MSMFMYFVEEVNSERRCMDNQFSTQTLEFIRTFCIRRINHQIVKEINITILKLYVLQQGVSYYRGFITGLEI